MFTDGGRAGYTAEQKPLTGVDLRSNSLIEILKAIKLD